MDDNQLAEQPSIDRERMRACGWTTCDFGPKTELALTTDIIAIAQQLGTPVPSRPRGGVCDKLQPIDANLAKPTP
jgi:hypothetical protein